MIETFPLPDPEAAVRQVDERLAQQDQDLGTVLMALAEKLQRRDYHQSRMLQNVQQTAGRVAQKRLAAQEQALAAVEADALAQADARLTRQETALMPLASVPVTMAPAPVVGPPGALAPTSVRAAAGAASISHPPGGTFRPDGSYVYGYGCWRCSPPTGPTVGTFVGAPGGARIWEGVPLDCAGPGAQGWDGHLYATYEEALAACGSSPPAPAPAPAPAPEPAPAPPPTTEPPQPPPAPVECPPCPEPAPAPAPPPPAPAPAGAIVCADRPDLAEASYCARLLDLREQLIERGKAILAASETGATEPAQALRDLVACFWDNMTPVAAVRMLFEQVFTCGAIGEWLRWWVGAVCGSCPTSPDRLVALLACKATLEGLAGLTVEGGKGIARNLSSSQIPFISGYISVIAGGQVGGGESAGAHLSLRPVLLPALDLVDQCIRLECPTELPSPGDAVQAWSMGQVDEDTARCWAESHGARWDQLGPVAIARAPTLSPQEVIQAGRRGNAAAEAIDAQLKARGWLRDDDRQLIQALYDQLPSPGQSQQWFARNLDSPAYVVRFGLLAGYGTVQEQLDWLATWQEGLPPDAQVGPATAAREIERWTETAASWGQGPTYRPIFAPALTAQGFTERTIGADYAAHWQLPSPAQLFEMYFRLRAGRVDEELVFTRDDLRFTLASADFPPGFVDRLVSIASPILPQTEVTQALQVGAVDQEAARELYADLGYTGQHLQVMLSSRGIVAIRQQTAYARGWVPSASLAAYAWGARSEEDTRNDLGALGLTIPQIDAALERAQVDRFVAVRQRYQRALTTKLVGRISAAYQAGVIDDTTAAQRLQEAGLSEGQAFSTVADLNAAVQLSLVSQATKAVRRALLGGELTAEEAAARLSVLGIQPARANQLLSGWQLELQSRARRLSTSQIGQKVAEGLLDPETAVERLGRLGWADPDRMFLLQQFLQKRADRLAREQRAALAERRRQEKELTALIRMTAQDQKRQRQELQRLRPISEVHRQYVRGVRSEDYVRRYLTAIGEPEDEQRARIEVWQVERAAWTAKKGALPEVEPPNGLSGGDGLSADGGSAGPAR